MLLAESQIFEFSDRVCFGSIGQVHVVNTISKGSGQIRAGVQTVIDDIKAVLRERDDAALASRASPSLPRSLASKLPLRVFLSPKLKVQKAAKGKLGRLTIEPLCQAGGGPNKRGPKNSQKSFALEYPEWNARSGTGVRAELPMPSAGCVAGRGGVVS